MNRNRDPKPASISFSDAASRAFSRDFRVSGFTFVRNGVKFGYPFLESIQSLLPSVDELIVNVGDSEDDTLSKVEALATEYPKIKILKSTWDDAMRTGGRVLAEQTNIAMNACTGDWGIYLQADEVLHEDDYMWTLDALRRAHTDPAVEGLVFDYLHFYGDYSVVNWNPSAYRREVRAIRLHRGVYSFGDAQGFRIHDAAFANGRKLRVKLANSRVYHYGWVRPPKVMQEKTIAFDKLYHGDGTGTGDNYKYKHIYGLEHFTGTHPVVMAERIAAHQWKENVLQLPLYFNWKDIRKVATRWIEKIFGVRLFEYRNYNLLR